MSDTVRKVTYNGHTCSPERLFGEEWWVEQFGPEGFRCQTQSAKHLQRDRRGFGKRGKRHKFIKGIRNTLHNLVRKAEDLDEKDQLESMRPATLPEAAKDGQCRAF